MGSEKKRKRKELGGDGGHTSAEKSAEKSERRKAKKSRLEDGQEDPAAAESDTIAEVPALVSPIATPMAGRKLTKKLYKLISHAAKEKALRRGIKEVVLAIRKADRGVVVMAGDVFPVDVIAHVPLLCEEADIPYCFVPRKTELGAAGLTKRPTSVALISEKKVQGDVKDELEKMKKEVAAIQNLY